MTLTFLFESKIANTSTMYPSTVTLGTPGVCVLSGHPTSLAAEEDLIGPTTHQKLKGNDNGREREEKCERLGLCFVGLRDIRHNPVGNPTSSATEEYLIGPTTHHSLKDNDNEKERREV